VYLDRDDDTSSSRMDLAELRHLLTTMDGGMLPKLLGRRRHRRRE
jgi:hypothetical protein